MWGRHHDVRQSQQLVLIVLGCVKGRILWWNGSKLVDTSGRQGWPRCRVVVRWQLRLGFVVGDWRKIGGWGCRRHSACREANRRRVRRSDPLKRCIVSWLLEFVVQQSFGVDGGVHNGSLWWHTCVGCGEQFYRFGPWRCRWTVRWGHRRCGWNLPRYVPFHGQSSWGRPRWGGCYNHSKVVAWYYLHVPIFRPRMQGCRKRTCRLRRFHSVGRRWQLGNVFCSVYVVVVAGPCVQTGWYGWVCAGCVRQGRNWNRSGGKRIHAASVLHYGNWHYG